MNLIGDPCLGMGYDVDTILEALLGGADDGNGLADVDELWEAHPHERF